MRKFSRHLLQSLPSTGEKVRRRPRKRRIESESSDSDVDEEDMELDISYSQRETEDEDSDVNGSVGEVKRRGRPLGRKNKRR